MVNIISFIKYYFIYPENGIRQLLTWFLNLVMKEEALLYVPLLNFWIALSSNYSKIDDNYI